MPIIRQCYDSHLHFFATGEAETALNLRQLGSPTEVKNLKIEKSHFRGDWLYGYGWDQSLWNINEAPSKTILDEVFPNFPVCFIRVDGHAAWVNSAALRVHGIDARFKDLPGGRIERGSNGEPTGVLVDTAKDLVEFNLPNYTRKQKTEFASSALKKFNRAGFTHLRDMTTTLEEIEILCEMDQKKQLTAYLELNALCTSPKDLDQAIALLEHIEKIKMPHLRAGAVKFYFDGALGSEGALLSQPYRGTEKSGLQLWEIPVLGEAIVQTWKRGHAVAIHSLGDEATHLLAGLLLQLRDRGKQGETHLEHVEVIRFETLKLLRAIQPTCHLQPCHWMSDRIWLKQKLGELARNAFPWRALEDHRIPFFFGSDSPIEEPSLATNFNSLEQAAIHGINSLGGDWKIHHTHPDPTWGSDCETYLAQLSVEKVIFDGEIIFTI